MDKGEMSGNVYETSDEDDFSNPVLSGKNLGIIKLAYGERFDEFENARSMIVVNGELVIYSKLIVTVPKVKVTLEEITELTINTANDCDVTVTIGGVEEIFQTTNKSLKFNYKGLTIGKELILISTKLYGSEVVYMEVVNGD